MLLGMELGIGLNLWGVNAKDGISSYPLPFFNLSMGISDKNNIETPPEFGGSLTAGAILDYYIFKWFSVSAGLDYHHVFQHIAYEVDLKADKTFDIKSRNASLDLIYNRGYLRIPASAHFNFSVFYMGVGFAYNIIILQKYQHKGEVTINGKKEYNETKEFDYSCSGYVEFFADVGFDFIRKKNKGCRLFVRVSPALTVTSPADKQGVILKDLKSFEASLMFQYLGTLTTLGKK